MDDLIGAADTHFTVINRDKPANSGIFDFLKYVFKTDIIYFNWIEKLAEKKGGVVQTMLLLSMVYLHKLFGFEIVWTMHNKLTHSGRFSFWSSAIFKAMLRNAKIVITHSSEGIAFGETVVPGSGNKIVYFPHPAKDRRTLIADQPGSYTYDILIWGSVAKYKNIHNFLKYLYDNGLEHSFRIMIIGKVYENYLEEIMSYKNEHIQIVDEFASNEELVALINESAVVLFTYSMNSVLSSGVLMDSLGYGANIVGPHVGAFADVAELGIIKTFKNFDEVIPIIESQMQITHEERSRKLDSFLAGNSWEQFAEKLRKIL